MFYTTHRSAGGKRGRRTAMTSSHRAVTRRVQILVSVTLCCECSPGSPCMPCLEQPCLEQQEPVLYYGLLMSCSTGCWAQTCLCHSLGRSWAANTSTCTGTGRETPGISPGTGQGEQRAGNSQPIVCTKISAAETSSFRNRHPHTLFPFYLGLAHGFRIRIC